MKYYPLYTIYLLSFLLFVPQIVGHGFSADTYIRTRDYWERIEQVCSDVLSTKRSIKSYDTTDQQHCTQNVLKCGTSITNCYLKLGFDERFHDDVICTPMQEFYLPELNEWVPAYQLEIGNHLLTEKNELIPLKHIEFVKKELTVYAIEVENTHTYFVGRRSVLTHNMFLPPVTLGLSIPFGTGIAGGALGGFFGPIAITSGFAFGGLLGYLFNTIIQEDKIPLYSMDLIDTDKLAILHKEKSGLKNAGNDAQAPGKPTENDGFIPPKRWDGEKVKNPNGPGYGWPDKKGEIWVPTGPNGHGCPHWDVQNEDGTHRNVVPGGRIRGQK